MKIALKTYLYYLIGSLVSFISSSFLKFKLGLNHNIFDIEFDCRKEVFILGTGESINSISDNGWERIKNSFSIGINYFLFHDFVPNVVQLELNEGEDTFYLENLNKIFHAREHEFRKSLILLKSNFHWKNLKKKEIFLSSLPESLKKNIRFCIDHPVPSSSLNEFKEAIKVLQKRKCFTKQKNAWVPHLRASIGLTTVLCIQNNVKNLYFGGVDLLNKTTFYDENKLNNTYSLNFIKKNREEKHGTDDTKISAVTISEVLKMINEDPYFSIKLYTVSEFSRLRDYLNYININ